MKHLFALLFFGCSFWSLAQPNRIINIDFNEVEGLHNKSFRKSVGAGRAYEGLRADWQHQLAMVKEECGFEFMRLHGIFHEDMAVYSKSEDGQTIYNWQYVDKLYDFLLSIGIKPFVELSFMPKALASGEQTIFWWNSNVTPPNDYNAYGNLIQNFTEHLVERYGEEEVGTWYFEVWNEPNHGGFFSGSMEEYFKMYRAAATAIKSVNQTYKVGGPASAGAGWIEEFIDYCASNKVPLDFISSHEYGVLGVLDVYGVRRIQMVKDPNRVANSVAQVAQWINEGKIKPLEVHFTEWSSSYSPRDAVHDTYQNATYVLNTLKFSEDIATSMSYWTFTDIFEEGGPPVTPFHGGFGLLNVQGIKKPTYYVYKYLNQLGSAELKNKDFNSWVCKEGSDVQALVWDFSYLYAKNRFNQTFYANEVPAKNKGAMEIVVKNLAKGIYVLEIYKTGYRQNDPYTAYIDLGKPSQLNARQVDYLMKKSAAVPILTEVHQIDSGTFSKTLEYRENDIFFLTLRKIN
ncbi:MAG: glycoside hydrolase [Bacteroidota bacterium]